MHLKALSCYVGLPAEPLLPTNASKRDCRDGGWKRAVLTGQRLIAHPVNRCIKLTSTLSDTLSGPEHYSRQSSMEQDWRTVRLHALRAKAETKRLEGGMQREVSNHPCFHTERARNKMTRIMLWFPEYQGRCDWLCAAWLHYSNCWCSSSLCSYPESFSSVVCHPKSCIHGLKSTQIERGELKDKKVESMEILQEEE